MAAASANAVRALGLGAAGLGIIYAGSNCLFNVEGGHRAIVFNRIGGLKDEVRLP
jgi:prohibitin 2